MKAELENDRAQELRATSEVSPSDEAQRHVAQHAHAIRGSARAARFGHHGAVVWLTGLSGAGKTTLAMALERTLFEQGCAVYVLDGDNLRHGLNADLGFSPEDRKENVRRVGEVAALFADAGVICIVALISPYRADRALARAAVRGGRFIEVHVAADLATCEARDPRGLYRLARAGKIKEFTGVDAPYEVPIQAEVVLDTARLALEEAILVLKLAVTETLAGHHVVSPVVEGREGGTSSDGSMRPLK